MSRTATGRLRGNEGPTPLPFTAADRITKTAEIRRLLATRSLKEKTTALEVLAASSLSDRPRIGIVVPKHGKNSVQRNRVKRRLKEIARTSLLPRLKTNHKTLDVLIRAKKQAYGRGFSGLSGEAKKTLEKICSSE
ncbi:MAG: ribonuclease P protein component [Gemmatimonadetes bacterium]|nr:ribonuclease P protein component [Gemmatimonadota bacterium]